MSAIDSNHKSSPAKPQKPSGSHGTDTREWYLEVLHEFALSQVGLNSLEEILWNVAKTAIARLGFVDCVIYLVDDSGQTLVQRAAHGPKNPIAQDIYNPITIPIGQGIVGTVAATGKPEKVGDTRLDPRYIEDDEHRLSELAVPIIHDDKVIGVLDSENPEPDFFTDLHLNLFSTIASLASTRIDTAMALDDLQQTVDELRIAKDRLSKQAEKLETARHEAEQASREKSQFLANMSHEIRTPMTSIVGFSELLSRGDQSTENRHQWAGQIKRNADFLMRLLNELLDLSKIETGAFEANFEPCDLRILLQDAYELTYPMAESKGLKFDAPKTDHLPERLMLDAHRVQQICLNLLTNAVKYTQAGKIILEARIVNAPTAREHLEIAVHDTGSGISASALERIFEPFTRQTKNKENIDGSGLGLAISRGLALGLGGELAASSERHVGSNFTLSLPVVPIEDCSAVTDSADIELADEDKSSLQGKAILVVEDTQSIALLIEHLLRDAGAKIYLAENGAEGEKMLLDAKQRESGFDLVLMDMMMPVMDGFEATRRIRASGIETPIVAMTAMAINDECEKCMEAGCDFFLTKPIKTAEFSAQICAILDSAEKKQQTQIEN